MLRGLRPRPPRGAGRLAQPGLRRAGAADSETDQGRVRKNESHVMRRAIGPGGQKRKNVIEMTKWNKKWQAGRKDWGGTEGGCGESSAKRRRRWKREGGRGGGVQGEGRDGWWIVSLGPFKQQVG